jgi:hypothetical protein
MLPPADASGNLPPGEYLADWDELVSRFGTTGHRRTLLKGLREALLILKGHGCTCAYLDGSFVTTKQSPKDFDACWVVQGVNLPNLRQAAPVLFDFSNRRERQKRRFGGELFPAHAASGVRGMAFLEFFQQDKASGVAKGIVRINMESIK